MLDIKSPKYEDLTATVPTVSAQHYLSLLKGLDSGYYPPVCFPHYQPRPVQPKQSSHGQINRTKFPRPTVLAGVEPYSTVQNRIGQPLNSSWRQSCLLNAQTRRVSSEPLDTYLSESLRSTWEMTTVFTSTLLSLQIPCDDEMRL